MDNAGANLHTFGQSLRTLRRTTLKTASTVLQESPSSPALNTTSHQDVLRETHSHISRSSHHISSSASVMTSVQHRRSGLEELSVSALSLCQQGPLCDAAPPEFGELQPLSRTGHDLLRVVRTLPPCTGTCSSPPSQDMTIPLPRIRLGPGLSRAGGGPVRLHRPAQSYSPRGLHS